MSWKGTKPTEFALQVLKDGDDHLRKISAEMLRGVIIASPVDEGGFRYNNRISVNHADSAILPSNGNKIPKGSIDPQAFFEGAEKILQAKLGDTVYLQNNLPYALRLENGHSQQAPSGIYGLTFLSVSSKYK
ncbi:hypothetical protein ABIC56_002796 [Acinetobacter bereziniae]|uniref:hypothetical protein n=1 Tax=Acinetobacter bereziniae TaxID=106648 RepID=UPI0022EB07DA|nr:hypothetical protein [Acinetobacter bereziniae]MDA3442642.1 hypothetical protein [Acinetobacter bereziniae]MDR6541618.1 hypothetical protein [Acinetobacter bereziniae]